MSEPITFSITAGADETISLRALPPIDISGMVLEWRAIGAKTGLELVKNNLATDAVGYAGGLTIANGPTGKVAISVDRTDTVEQTADLFSWTIRQVDSGSNRTLLVGLMYLLPGAGG